MEPDKKIMDFFKAQVKLEKEPNTLVKLWAMTLYTGHSLLSRMQWRHFAAVFVLLLSSAWMANYAYHSNDRMILEQKQVAQQKASTLEAEKNINEQAKIKKTQQIEAIKKITPEEMQAIKNHIVKARDKEINKLKEIYWTYVFIINNDYKLDMSEVNTVIRNQMKVVNNFYSTRLTEVTANYQNVKDGHLSLIYDTFDGADSLDKILIWQNLTKNSQITFLESTDNIVAKSTHYLRSPVKLGQYLKENKEMIDTNPIFSQ